MSFKKYYTHTKRILSEGGNSKAIDLETGETIAHAEKIDLHVFDRGSVRSKVVALFERLNKMFQDEYDEPLWSNFEIIKSGKAFTGSTEFFFDPNISDEEFTKYKRIVGDIDVTIKEEDLQRLWELLATVQGDEIIPGIVYLGQDKMNLGSTAQLVTIWELMEGENTVNFQVDFEGAEYDDEGNPSDWAKFSHNSNWEDIKSGFKGVVHKYAITNMVRAISKREDIVVLTPTSTPEKPRIKKLAKAPTMLAFSVTRGLRVKLEPVEFEDGSPLEIEGKLAFKEKLTNESDYETDLKTIFEIIFSKVPSKEDLQKFSHFRGALDLASEYLDEQQQDDFVEFILGTIWKGRARALGNDPEEDLRIKSAMFNEIIRRMPQLKDKYQPIADEMIEEYYKDYENKIWGA